MNLTQEQFSEEFVNRLRMLYRSAEAYDFGDYSEASRMASCIVKLIGDRTKANGDVNRQYVSLLTRLGREKPDFIDTSLAGVLNNQELHGPACILGFHLAGCQGMIPVLDGFEEWKIEENRKIPFDSWWNNCILRDSKGYEFSRKHIVQTMRDKEDAHNDEELGVEYGKLTYGNSLGVFQIEKSPMIFDQNPARVVVRQVAHEVLRTLSPNVPKKYIPKIDNKVMPIQLAKIYEQLPDGSLHLILDHSAIEFKIENTASNQVWDEWEKFAKEISIPQTMQKPPDAKSKNFQVQLVMINHAPYVIEGVRASISMMHPV